MSSEVLFIPDIHIGNCISECIQKSPFTKAEIARSINMNPANFNKLLKKKSIETDRLIEISLALAYNFFAAWNQDPNKDQGIKISIERPESVGKLIENQMKIIGITQKTLAEKLGVTQPEINRIINKASFDTDKLATISKLLSHNFFQDFYSITEIPTEKEQYSDHYAYLITRVEQLAGENERLKFELEEVKAENTKLKEHLSK